MTPETATDMIRAALMTTFWLSLPVLAAGFLFGILLSLIQIVTSLQDPSFSAVPRLLVFGGVVMLLLPWMTTRIMDYTFGLWGDFARYAR